MRAKTIFLVGPRACGKTTLASHLAKKYGYRAIDLDVIFAETVSQSIEEYVAANGWPAFRKKECEVFEETIKTLDKGEDTVVSTGGGLVLEEKNRDLLKESGLVVYLDVPVEKLIERLKFDPKSSQRPKLARGTLEDEVRATVASREKLYRSVADCTVSGMMALDTIAEQIFSH